MQRRGRGGERELMEVGQRWRRNICQHLRSHTGDCQGYTQESCAATARVWAAKCLGQGDIIDCGTSPRHLSSTQTAKAVENKTVTARGG